MGETTNGCSVADMAALLNNGGGCNNWQNSPFMYLIWLAYLGGNGFGGFGRNGQGIQDAEIMNQLNSIRQTMADYQNTNSISGMLGSINDNQRDNMGAINMGFANTNAAINNASMQNLMGQKDAAAQMASCCCDIKSNILNQTNALQSRIDQLANGTQTGFANIGYAIAQQTNDIKSTLCANETQNLRDKLAQASQDAQTANIVNQLKSSCGC